MNERQLALRRTDLFGCGAMLLSGLAAQAAMWRASPQPIDRIAALAFVVVSLLASSQLRWSDGGRPTVRMLATVAKILACTAVLVAALTTGALVALKHGTAHPSTTTAVGAILLIVQVVQSASVSDRRDLALGAPVVCAMLTQAGMATSDAKPAVPFAISLVAMVIAIALVHRAELLDDTTVATTRGARAALLEATTAPLVRVIVVAGVVFVLLPNSFHLAAHASTGSAAPGKSDTATSESGDPGVHSRALVDPSTGRLDLRVRGALSNTPIFVAPASASAYWQGAVYDNYDGVTWTMTGPNPASDWESKPSTGVPVQQAPADVEQPAGAQLVTRDDAVQVVSAQPPTVVFAPGRAISYTGPGRVTVDVDGNARLDDVPAGPPSAHDYDVRSTRPVLAPELTGGPVRASAGDNTDARWTQVPSELPSRVRQLGTQLVGRAANRAAAVLAVDDYLRSNETYDISAPLPSPGEDSVDDFLFVSHVGFCEQYASAAVMLLRSAGIPARLVTGYAQGDVASEPGRRVMRGSDAHAWVQVWYAGLGWVDADPTSGSSLSGGSKAASVGTSASASASSEMNATPSAAAAVPSASAAVPSAAAASPSAAARVSPSVPAALPLLGRAVARLPGGRFVLAIAIALLAVVLRFAFGAGRRWLRRRAEPQVVLRARPVEGGPILQAYFQLDAALAAAGRPAVAGQTPWEVTSRLVGLGYQAAELAAAVDLLERECFGAEPPSHNDVLVAVAAFDSLCHVLRNNAAFTDKASRDSLV